MTAFIQRLCPIEHRHTIFRYQSELKAYLDTIGQPTHIEVLFGGAVRLTSVEQQVLRQDFTAKTGERCNYPPATVTVSLEMSNLDTFNPIIIQAAYVQMCLDTNRTPPDPIPGMSQVRPEESLKASTASKEWYARNKQNQDSLVDPELAHLMQVQGKK